MDVGDKYIRTVDAGGVHPKGLIFTVTELPKLPNDDVRDENGIGHCISSIKPYTPGKKKLKLKDIQDLCWGLYTSGRDMGQLDKKQLDTLVINRLKVLTSE